MITPIALGCILAYYIIGLLISRLVAEIADEPGVPMWPIITLWPIVVPLVALVALYQLCRLVKSRRDKMGGV